MPLITKIEVKGGTVYEFGKPWPVKDKAEGLTGVQIVGLIRLCPEEEEGDDESATRLPPHYEIWCVSKSLFDHFFYPISRALFKGDKNELDVLKAQEIVIAQDFVEHKNVRKRKVFLSQVTYEDEFWQTNVALGEILLETLEETGEPVEEEEEPEEGAAILVQPDPGNGEVKVAEPAS